MEDNDLLDAYTEVFVMGDEDAGELMPHFECSRCERDVSDDPCPDHAPTGAPGLRLVECWSEPKHQLWVINRDDYGYPCPECRLIPHVEQQIKDQQCKHWAWRRTAAWRWLVSQAYSLGVISGSGASWGNGHDWCTTVSSFKGQRPYILGVSRYTWRCWLKFRHRRGDDLGMFGFCSKCLPCSACGSKRFDHEDDCPEAAS